MQVKVLIGVCDDESSPAHNKIFNRSDFMQEISHEIFKRIWDALEKEFPPLTNGKLIQEMTVKESDHKFSPKGCTCKITIEFVYGYREEK